MERKNVKRISMRLLVLSLLLTTFVIFTSFDGFKKLQYQELQQRFHNVEDLQIFGNLNSNGRDHLHEGDENEETQSPTKQNRYEKEKHKKNKQNKIKTKSKYSNSIEEREIHLLPMCWICFRTSI